LDHHPVSFQALQPVARKDALPWIAARTLQGSKPSIFPFGARKASGWEAQGALVPDAA